MFPKSGPVPPPKFTSSGLALGRDVPGQGPRAPPPASTSSGLVPGRDRAHHPPCLWILISTAFPKATHCRGAGRRQQVWSLLRLP